MNNPSALLPLFAQIQTPPPAAPGSATSRRAAIAAKGQRRATTLQRILACLADAHPRALAREEICRRTDVRESTACARLGWDLIPQWVERVESAGVTSSGEKCDCYRLTPAGMERAREVVRG